MIVTVTPNPSVDRTVFVDALHLGKIMRSTRSWSEPSGKGVNVALALRAHDRPTLAVLPVGGPAGAHLVEMLNRAGLSYQPVPIAGEVRINISLIQPDGIVTKINEQGPTLTEAEGQALLDAARTRAQAGDWLAGCGSLPGGLTDDYYAQTRRDRSPRRRQRRDRHLRATPGQGPGRRTRPDQTERRRTGRRRRRNRHHHRRRRRRRSGTAGPRGEDRTGQPRSRRRTAGRAQRARFTARRPSTTSSAPSERATRCWPATSPRPPGPAWRSGSRWPGALPRYSTTAPSSPRPTTHPGATQ